MQRGTCAGADFLVGSCGGLMLAMPEGLHPVEVTHIAVCGDLVPVGRTHIGGLCGGLCPVERTLCWRRGKILLLEQGQNL